MSVVIKLEAQPVWARMEVMTALTGIPDNTVRHLYNEHKIRARKVRDADMPDGKGVSSVFHVGDALEWLEIDAVPPREYALKGKFGNGDGLVGSFHEAHQLATHN